MTTLPSSPFLIEVRHDLGALRRNWGWFVALGALLMVLGLVALGSVVVASLASAIAIGMLMLIGGVVETVGAFWSRHWSGFFLHLLAGVLSVVVGVLFLRAPVGALLALTLLLACLLMVGGLFRIIAALTYRFASWGWSLAGGIIDMVLGVLVWLQWPTSALWVLGLFLGISLIFRGADWMGLGFALRGLRRGDGGAPAAGRPVATGG